MNMHAVPYFLRLKDLRERGIVASRQAVRSLQIKQGFPRGHKLGHRTVVWTTEEINNWLEGRSRHFKSMAEKL